MKNVPEHIKAKIDALCTPTINMCRASDQDSDYAKSVGELVQDIIREYEGPGKLAYTMDTHIALGATSTSYSDTHLYTWRWEWVEKDEAD